MAFCQIFLCYIYSMGTLVLAVILSVVQATPPGPRKAADGTARASGNVQRQTNLQNEPLAKSLPSPDKVRSEIHDEPGSKQGDKDAQQAVRVTEFPPVSVTKDWADWGVWAFSGLLVLVGFLQAWLLKRTLKYVRRQTHEMRHQRHEMWRQRNVMEGQLKTMQDQLGQIQRQASEMEKQTRHLEISVTAAKTSADIAARTSVPTLVIDKFESGDVGAASLEATLQYPKVRVVIKNYGQTPAFLRSWNVVFTCEPLPAVPNYWIGPSDGIVLERDVVLPNEPYILPELPGWKRTEIDIEDVREIISRKKHLWVYGFICYYDLFGSPLRRMKFCEVALNFWSGGIHWVSGFSPDAYLGTEDYIFPQAPSATGNTEKQPE